MDVQNIFKIYLACLGMGDTFSGSDLVIANRVFASKEAIRIEAPKDASFCRSSCSSQNGVELYREFRGKYTTTRTGYFKQ
ncbi:Uncharacterised protein (plasmid) [Legionella adelaidensis]|uniref:Uncharacterized protein n=1 Tax=Legionella adelaidensis TaxID=45056 RepID=A0A0W0R5Z5_9GAMM|nr:hypothetical protein [Legionella adelaidensis]KTC66511.1 hypothetical protein Lade_1169 [Legionella adelaidensis]VEH85792.1 Uncharacterised protein [Legionella adelaidensis]